LRYQSSYACFLCNDNKDNLGTMTIFVKQSGNKGIDE